MLSIKNDLAYYTDCVIEVDPKRRSISLEKLNETEQLLLFLLPPRPSLTTLLSLAGFPSLPHARERVTSRTHAPFCA